MFTERSSSLFARIQKSTPAAGSARLLFRLCLPVVQLCARGSFFQIKKHPCTIIVQGRLVKRGTTLIRLQKCSPQRLKPGPFTGPNRRRLLFVFACEARGGETLHRSAGLAPTAGSLEASLQSDSLHRLFKLRLLYPKYQKKSTLNQVFCMFACFFLQVVSYFLTAVIGLGYTPFCVCARCSGVCIHHIWFKRRK